MTDTAQRRRFTAVYKLKVLDEAAGCRALGELGALLRREGLYSSHLAAATKRADRAEAIVAIQKKMAALFGDLPSSDPS